MHAFCKTLKMQKNFWGGGAGGGSSFKSVEFGSVLHNSSSRVGCELRLFNPKRSQL